MTEAKHCPHCGAPLPDATEQPPVEPPVQIAEPDQQTGPPADLDESIPDMPLLAPGSNDDTFLNSPVVRKIAPIEPDPLLGAFVASGAPVGSSLSTDHPLSKPASTRKHGSSSNFPAIHLESTAAPSVSTSKAPVSHPDPDDEEVADEPRSAWSSVLLASYASAVTLALAWFVMKDRNRDKSDPVVTSTTNKTVQPPTNSDLSRKVQLPEPIEGEHLAKLGQPLQVGSLEITPLDVKRRDVKLQRATVIAEPELRDGGKKALVLRLKLRNISKDTTFAPLDPAYLREHGETLVDTFVTTARDERVYPFPLAIESEWSIVGQDFAELRPGESRIVAIPTRPDAPPDDEGPFTWRIRLRTGIKRTDAIGLISPAPNEAPVESKEEKK